MKRLSKYRLAFAIPLVLSLGPSSGLAEDTVTPATSEVPETSVAPEVPVNPPVPIAPEAPPEVAAPQAPEVTSPQAPEGAPLESPASKPEAAPEVPSTVTPEAPPHSETPPEASVSTGVSNASVAPSPGGHEVSSGLSLDDLLSLSTTVASKKPLTPREAPGIISVVTDEDIRSMGARDLIDVLHSVPGFYFGIDVPGAVGLGFRGTWGHEGKVLLLVDDHEMNELSFSTTQFGNRFPMDQIKRIEIIRGPGSAMYGGNAELAVIKIFTKSGSDLNGAYATARYGQMEKGIARDTISLQVGKQDGDFSAKIAGFIGSGNRGNRDYTDLSGVSYNLAGNNTLNPNQLNIGIKYKDLNASFLYDSYVVTYRDGFGPVLPAPPAPIHENFDTLSANLKYDIKPIDGLTITPQLNFLRTRPWASNGKDAKALAAIEDDDGNNPYAASYYNKITNRYSAGLNGSYDFTENLNLIAGLEKSVFMGTDTIYVFNTTGTHSINFNSTALYSQILWKPEIFTITAGARYGDHNKFGPAFVPRLAITKVIDQFHIKALASKAFRAPAIQNLDLRPTIKPEFTTVFELETGYQLSKELFLVANVFDTTIDQPIVYFVQDGNDAYDNFPKSGSRGFEVESRWVTSGMNSRLSYSFFSSAGKNHVGPWAVPGRDDITLGFPQHKIAWNSQFHLGEKYLLSPSIIYMSNRYGYDVDPEQLDGETSILRNYPGVVLANLYFRMRDVFIENLNIGVGIYNIIDADLRLIQPYLSTGGTAHPPLPALPRELTVDIAYQVSL